MYSERDLGNFPFICDLGNFPFISQLGEMQMPREPTKKKCETENIQN